LPVTTAQWIVEGRVLYAYAWGNFTIDELLAHDARMVELAEAGTAPVHALLHSDIETPPSLRLDVARSISQALGHPALGWVLLIDRQNSIVQFISRTLARFFGVKYKNFPNLEEAIAFLEAEDASINWDHMDESPLAEHSG
jgi:hypothetical protein